MKFSSFEGLSNFPVPDLLLSPLPRPPALAHNLYLPVLAPNLCFLALANNFITNPGPDLVYIDLVSSICICIYGPGPRFVLLAWDLNLHLPYY